MPYQFRPADKAILFRPAIVFLISAFATTNGSASEVTVYTVSSIAVNASAGTRIIHLDTAETIETILSTGLSHDPASAVNLARQRLQDGGAKLQRDLADAYDGIAEAWSLGIVTVPAVVVDRRYVVYGEPDVARALTKVEAFRRAQP